MDLRLLDSIVVNRPIAARRPQARPACWILAILLIGCGPSDQPLTKESLSAARLAWERQTIQDYNLEWVIDGTEKGVYVVFVRDGQVGQARRIEPNGREIILPDDEAQAYSVPGLFERLEA